MDIPKRLLPVGAVACAFGVLAFAVPAQAATTSSCLVSGTAATGEVNLQNGLPNNLPGDPFIDPGGPQQAGTYTFSNGLGTTPLQLVCSSVSGDNHLDTFLVNMASQGNFVNYVCGTGIANSTNNALNSATDEIPSSLEYPTLQHSPFENLATLITPTLISNSNYQIAFAGG